MWPPVHSPGGGEWRLRTKLVILILATAFVAKGLSDIVGTPKPTHEQLHDSIVGSADVRQPETGNRKLMSLSVRESETSLLPPRTLRALFNFQQHKASVRDWYVSNPRVQPPYLRNTSALGFDHLTLYTL